MSDNSYERRIQTKAAPSHVYAALTRGFAHWWTIKAGVFEKPGDIVRFGFAGRQGYWSFKAIELSPERVELECVEALHIHEGQPKSIETEWLGTRAIWQITPLGQGCEITFTHQGLTPNLLCFDVCEAGWDLFFVKSLQAYLDTGVGTPHS